jgi:hypothetical protein
MWGAPRAPPWGWIARSPDQKPEDLDAILRGAGVTRADNVSTRTTNIDTLGERAFSVSELHVVWLFEDEMRSFPGRFRSWAIRKGAMVGDKFSHRGNAVGAAMPVGIDDYESGMFEFDAGDPVGEFVPPMFNLHRVGGGDSLPIFYQGWFVPLARLVLEHSHREYRHPCGGETKGGIEIGLPVIGGSGTTHKRHLRRKFQQSQFKQPSRRSVQYL